MSFYSLLYPVIRRLTYFQHFDVQFSALLFKFFSKNNTEMAGKESNKQQINMSDENNSEDNVNSSFASLHFHWIMKCSHIFMCVCVCVCFFLKKFLFFF